MKKIYLIGLLLGTTSLVFSQNTVQRNHKVVHDFKAIPQSSYTPTKALGDSIWGDDFDDPTQWTINNDGQTDSVAGWNINSTVDGSFFSNPVAAPGEGNFAELGNGIDLNNVAAIDVEYTMTTANSLDIVALGGSQNVILEFLQYGARFNDVQAVQISTDGTTFTTVADNNNKEILSQSSPNAEYPNPDHVMVNLTSYLPANPTQVWIRFSWTSAFPTDMSNGAWVTYGWMIDNVQIATLPDNDILTQGKYMGTDTLTYYQIPLDQVAPIDGVGFLKNNGSENQVNVKFQANETVNSVYSSESDAASILPGEADSLRLNSAFTPSAMGDYKLEFSVVADNPDDVPLNNTFATYEFSVGGNLYVRDDATDAESGVVNGQLATYQLSSGDLITAYANAYDIFTDADLTAIDFQFGNEITDGAQIVGKLLDGSRDNVIAETEFYNVASGDGGTYHSLKFDTPQSLVAGETYWATIAVFSDTLSVATSGLSDLGSVIQTPDGSWGSFPAGSNPTYVIRMNFDPTLAVESNELSNLNVGNSYPNPFANTTTVEFNLNEAAEVSYSVVDMAGKEVASSTVGNKIAGEHKITIDGTSFANGVYYLKMTAGASIVTRKLVVNK